MKTFYKFLGPNGEAIHGTGAWHLPKKGNKGKWMPKIEHPVLCQSGYHVCEKKDLLGWLRPDCWFVEVKGPEIVGDNKSVFQQGRLLKKSALNKTGLRLFASECAEHALKFVKNPEERKVLEQTILVVRAFAFGLATQQELFNARDKAHEVRRRTAYADAAYAANAAADAAYDAAYAANAAAYAAANAAYAYAAAADPGVRRKEKEWQADRLAKYIHGEVDLVALKQTVEKKFNKKRN